MRRRQREVEIFNFSFLDILACTIGLLLFILVMIFILQKAGPLSDIHAMIQSKIRDARNIERQTREVQQVTAALMAQTARIKDPRNPLLIMQCNAAKREYETARLSAQHALHSLRAAESLAAALSVTKAGHRAMYRASELTAPGLC